MITKRMPFNHHPGQEIEHGRPVSLLISTSSLLTEGNHNLAFYDNGFLAFLYIFTTKQCIPKHN